MMTEMSDENYFEEFLKLEGAFREKYKDCYFSAPQLIDTEEGLVYVSPWGLPGTALRNIFSITDYYIITQLDESGEMINSVFDRRDLIYALKSKYLVHTLTDPVMHYCVEFPDYLDPGTEAAEEFNALIASLPKLN